VRTIRKKGLLLTLQLLCSAVFLTAGGATVGIKGGQAVLSSLSSRETQLSTAEATESPTAQGSAAPIEPTEPQGPEEGTPIVQVDLSLSGGTGDILFKNETDYTFDPEAILGSGYPIEPVGKEPSVLIIHTHATECYTEEGAELVTETRSADEEKNMIAIGKAMTDAFEASGVGAVHCTVLHDSPSYSEAYPRSKETVKEYLAKYPSIRYVIDVHRDAITTQAGDMAKPITDGLAQLMLVVGTDEAGADHPGWKTNLCVALRAQAELLKVNDQLMRPINLRSASFNQQLSEGFLLLEVGSCANTVEEAKASAELFVKYFAAMIKNP